jgi:twinkle protein
MQKDNSGAYPVPRPYDVSGSAHFYNKADNCISIWRDSANEDVNTRNTIQVHVQKIRFKHVGKIGVAELKWDYLSGYFKDPSCPKGDLYIRFLEKQRGLK